VDDRRKSPALDAKPARPPSDATCTKVRTVTHGKTQLDVWSCSALAFGEPLDEPPRVTIAPVVIEIGRRLWRFFFITRAATERIDARYDVPGWYFVCLYPDPSWISNDPVGPYEKLETAISDLTSAERTAGADGRPGGPA
jgi:hypothetical protein